MPFDLEGITPPSTDATLSALTVNDGTTAHPINLATPPYTQDVANAVTALTLTATVNDAGAAVSAVTLGGIAIADTDFSDGIAVPSLILGDNAIVLTVTAADDSTTQTYTLTVTRTVPSLTGAPTISGTAQVDEELTADVSGIMDADGLTSPGYIYQWLRVDGTDGTETNISGATSATYTLVGDDAGNAVRVRVNFTDDAANPETLTSAVYPSNGTIAPATGGAPEIAVQGNGFNISSRDEIPRVQDHTDFGSVSLLDATGQNEFAERTFTILNTGDGILALGTDAVSLVVAPPGLTSGMSGSLLSFSVTQQPAATVAPGGETTFTIRFDPLGAGPGNLYVSLANDDDDESPYLFRIAAIGVAPQLGLSWPGEDTLGESLLTGDRTASFGTVASETADVIFTVANTGLDPLTLGPDAVSLGGDDAADYSVVTQPAATVAPGASTTFTLRFDPSVAGLRQATATLNVINDLNFRPSVSFDLEGVTGGTVSIAAKRPTEFYYYSAPNSAPGRPTR